MKVVSDFFEHKKFTLIAGPCVIENYEICDEVAQKVKALTDKYNVGYIFKASFDKANRTSFNSFRGPGLEGLEILAAIRAKYNVPILTDIHLPEQAKRVAEVVDVLQIPAFLCRQTDLITAAASTGKPVNIKKGQFLSPQEMCYVIDKFKQSSGSKVSITERGTTFGYNNLVVDMRGLHIMRAANVPIVFDATHSTQLPGADNGVSGGDRLMSPVLARAAVAVGVDGLFCEVHPNPDKALSDSHTSLTFELLEQILYETKTLNINRSLL